MLHTRLTPVRLALLTTGLALCASLAQAQPGTATAAVADRARCRADQIVIDLVRVPIPGALLRAEYRGDLLVGRRQHVAADLQVGARSASARAVSVSV